LLKDAWLKTLEKHTDSTAFPFWNSSREKAHSGSRRSVMLMSDFPTSCVQKEERDSFKYLKVGK
jgi:hypothetical protein